MRRTWERVDSAEVALQRLVGWLAALPADLTRRALVVVPGEPVAHALRRRVCLDERRPGLLAGVRLCPPAACAREVLARAGQAALPGGEAVRRLRILDLFQSGTVPLRYFRAEQLRAGRGYVEAFARAIADLERGGLTAADTDGIADDLVARDARAASRLHDVAAVWMAAEMQPWRQLSEGQLLQRAATALQENRGLQAALGPVAALVTAEPSASLIRFLGALGDCRVVYLDALPLRTGTQRWRARALPAGPERLASGSRVEDLGPLFAWRSPSTAPAVVLPSHSEPPAGELPILQRFLFATPEVLSDRERARSRGPDGSVELEEFASAEEEVNAAAIWVAEQVSAGIPLEHIALIVPEIEPYARLLLDRLGRIGMDRGPAAALPAGIAAYVAGGLRVADTGAGLRLLSLLRAWRRGLDVESTLRVLPALRADEAGPPLTPSAAAKLIYGAGIVGGSPSDADGVREWMPRLQRRLDSLRRVIADAGGDAADEPEKQRHQWDRDKAVEAAATLASLMPSIAALQAVAEQVLAGKPLRILWPAVRAFVERWVRLIPDPPNLLSMLDERLAPVLADEAAARVCGFSALDWLIDLLHRERIAVGRYGEPRVFIGTPAGAAGLVFAAVRVLGLAEGALPRTPHDDPIVPNGLRQLIEQRARRRGLDVVLPCIEDRVLEDIHNFHRLIGATRRCLALSVPRQWIDRSEREISGVLLEVAAALDRPSSLGGDGEANAARLRGDYFKTDRAAPRAPDGVWQCVPHSAVLSLPRRETGAWAVPSGWLAESATALDRVRALAASLEGDALAEADGMLERVRAAIAMPGLSPEHPLSATALSMLWSCPFRFFLERVLHFDEPVRRPPTDSIEPLAYGSLLHAAAEALFREAGPAICARVGSPAQWIDRARAIAAEQFDQLCDEYPLRGADAVARERERLQRQIEQLVRYEWEMGPRTFAGVELAFGRPAPVRLELGGPLYVRGAIDRLDRLDAGWSVRDLKTGRVRDLAEEPMGPVRDLQIGLYALVVETDPAFGGAVVHAAYVHPSQTQEPERAFRGAELRALRARTREWLDIARELLAAGSFPRTPNAEDCQFCPFAPTCGEGAQARSAAKLRATPLPRPLERFLAVKSTPPREE